MEVVPGPLQSVDQFDTEVRGQSAGKPQPSESREPGAGQNPAVILAQVVRDVKDDGKQARQIEHADANAQPHPSPIGGYAPEAPIPEALRKEKNGQNGERDKAAEQHPSPVQELDSLDNIAIRVP